jgi:hypothetical protein
VTERKDSGEEVSVFVATSGLFIYVPMRLQHFSQHMNQSLPWARSSSYVVVSSALLGSLHQLLWFLGRSSCCRVFRMVFYEQGLNPKCPLTVYTIGPVVILCLLPTSLCFELLENFG